MRDLRQPEQRIIIVYSTVCGGAQAIISYEKLHDIVPGPNPEWGCTRGEGHSRLMGARVLPGPNIATCWELDFF